MCNTQCNVKYSSHRNVHKQCKCGIVVTIHECIEDMQNIKQNLIFYRLMIHTHIYVCEFMYFQEWFPVMYKKFEEHNYQCDRS